MNQAAWRARGRARFSGRRAGCQASERTGALSNASAAFRHRILPYPVSERPPEPQPLV